MGDGEDGSVEAPKREREGERESFYISVSPMIKTDERYIRLTNG